VVVSNTSSKTVTSGMLKSGEQSSGGLAEQLCGESIGLIAGNTVLPRLFAKNAKRNHCRIVAVCYIGETDQEIEKVVDECVWIKVGQLGKLIETFTEAGVKYAAMVGGINRVKLFGGVKLDLKGAMLLAKLRSTKDDVIMCGVATELAAAGIEVISSVCFLKELLVTEGVMTRSRPSEDELVDIQVGTAALKAMSGQDIGQLVVVRDGVVVAVEAVEGSDAAIRRGGELGGKGTVVVKFAKSTQDMRFDVPTIGSTTIQTMIQAHARVLALEAGRCLVLGGEEVIKLANSHKIAIVGCEPLAIRLSES